MNRKIFSKIALVLVVSSLTFAFTISKDRLHKRDFTVSVIDGKKPKAIPDEISFKDGKVFCGEFADTKLGIGTWIKYELVKDSTYTEEGEEREYIEVLATTDELGKDETFEFKCVIDNFEIEGSMRITKKGKDKKTATFSGKEKPKKKDKKDKKDKDEK